MAPACFFVDVRMLVTIARAFGVLRLAQLRKELVFQNCSVVHEGWLTTEAHLRTAVLSFKRDEPTSSFLDSQNCQLPRNRFSELLGCCDVLRRITQLIKKAHLRIVLVCFGIAQLAIALLSFFFFRTT